LIFNFGNQWAHGVRPYNARLPILVVKVHQAREGKRSRLIQD
jgi:hypothetical protein